MKRSLVAAAAAALLLTGCATGETGHLDPEIDPELTGPRSIPQRDLGPDDSLDAGEDGDVVSGTDDDAPDPGTDVDIDTDIGSEDVEAAFTESSATEAWFGDVSAVDVDGDLVLVTTLLTDGGADAVAVCEAALEAAESSGVVEPSVEVRDADGATLSQRDAAAGDEACSG